MRRNLHNHGRSRLWLLNTAQREVSLVLLKIVILSEFINTFNLENSSVSNQSSSEFNFITGQVSVSNELLAWLVHVKCLRESLSPQIYREGVPAVVGEMDLPNLDSIVSQEVVPLELQVGASGIEPQNLPVIV